MAVSENDKQKLFILMAKLNPTFKKREVLNEDFRIKEELYVGNKGINIGDTFTHKHLPGYSAEILDFTNNGYKVKETNPKGKSKIAFYNKIDFTPDKGLWNPTQKFNEEEDKWIQKAVNPEHKGYCTPMTKPTCTPARKALAKRFKKGIDEEYTEATPEELKIKAERVKAAIDELVTGNDEFGILRTLYRLLVERKKASGMPQPAITSEVIEIEKPKIS